VNVETENYGDIVRNAVEPSECGPTAFRSVQNKYIGQLVQDPIALDYYSLFLDINYISSVYLDQGEQYFGAEGDYTKLMVKRERELESFWNMEDEIRVQGQHTATLTDRDVFVQALSQFFTIGGQPIPMPIVNAYADELAAAAEASPNLPENPFFATDGFATYSKTIVIGDGLVSWMAETGISEDIVWTGIFSHEWAHQVQFKNYGEWYPEGAAQDPAEATRYTELEADFLAAYFMTHKRGATYNWKRVEEFYELFFQIGDCGFDSSGHHGTPAQRLNAAQLGFEVANSAQKQGQILTADEAHKIFTENIDSLL
ncbi:MAG: hypothetical protein WB492_08550, partial [Christiangramia sp.]